MAEKERRRTIYRVVQKKNWLLKTRLLFVKHLKQLQLDHRETLSSRHSGQCEQLSAFSCHVAAYLIHFTELKAQIPPNCLSFFLQQD